MNIPDERLQKLEIESAENLAGWQRARADYQNLKRECDEKIERLSGEVKRSMLRELLPMYDTLRLATQSPPDPEHVQQWIDGIIQIRAQIDALLKKWNVSTISTLHQPFDPEIHEALQAENGVSDIVVKELQAGYVVDGKLLYPAKVVVGEKGKDKAKKKSTHQ